MHITWPPQSHLENCGPNTFLLGLIHITWFLGFADALTSVLAIVALGVGYVFNWWVFDPLIGILGGVIIVRWAFQLIKDTSWVLLDARSDLTLENRINHYFSHQDGVWVTDLHIWDLGLGRHACIVTLVAEEPRMTNEYKSELLQIEPFVHCSIEVYSLKESNR